MDGPNSEDGQIQHWLDQMKAGNADARDQVIKHAQRRLELLTRKMLGGFARLRRWEETGDVLNNALLKLHRSLAEIQPESVGKFFALATQQIRWTLLDLKRHYFGPEGVGSHHHTAGDGSAADDTGGPIRQTAGNSSEPETVEGWTRFHEAVERMPVNERAVFDLLFYQGMTQTEAASALEVDERTIRRRKRSAEVWLHDALNGEPPEQW